MNYSLHTLTNAYECDVLLTFALNKKKTLIYKKLTDERNAERHAETARKTDAALSKTIYEIAAFDTILSLLPDGEIKDSALDKRLRLESKKYELEMRKERYGTVTLLEKEINLACVDHELHETDAFIAAIRTKKSQLEK